MQASSHPAIPRSRVKTGCLACRQRRRKCDENRPRCINCTKRGATCQYPNFRRVLPYPSPNSEIDNVGFGTQSLNFTRSSRSNENGDRCSIDRSRPSIDDPEQNSMDSLHDDFEPDLINSEPPVSGHINPPTEVIFNQSQRSRQSATHTNLHPLSPAGWRRIVGVTANSSPVTSNGTGEVLGMPWSGVRITDTNDISARSIQGTDPSVSTLDTIPASTILAAATTQADVCLLSHFRYHIAPWLDITDPEASFGIKLLTKARDNSTIMTVVLVLAATHKSITTSTNRTNHAQMSNGQTIADTEFLISRETISVQRNCRMLLKVRSLIGSSPQQWRQIISESNDYLELISTDAVEEAFLQWCYRIDLAAAVMTRQPLLIHHRVWKIWQNTQQSVLRNAAQDEPILLTLAECLSLGLEGPHSVAATGPASSNFPSTQRDTGHLWLNCWNACQLWYEKRPPEICQFLSCRSTEAGIIDPSSTARFPINIFLSPMALVYNVAYHTASILLLASKPRLVELPISSRQASSKAWHMHSIAGACERNDFAEQWDPVLIAGLFLIAPDMTHKSQQQVVLECFRKASRATGLNLADEIVKLQVHWQP